MRLAAQETAATSVVPACFDVPEARRSFRELQHPIAPRSTSASAHTATGLCRLRVEGSLVADSLHPVSKTARFSCGNGNVLVAVDPKGVATLARRELRRGMPYRCPVCRAAVVLHGRRRRADLLVEDGVRPRFTVEIQDSPISVDEMKARERLDRAAGCAATCWIFTERRISPLVFEPPPWPARRVEARIPGELRWRWHVTHLPVLCLHVERRRLYGLHLGSVVRGTTAWVDAGGNPRITPARRLRSRSTVLTEPLSFVPELGRGRYGGPVVTFERPALTSNGHAGPRV